MAVPGPVDLRHSGRQEHYLVLNLTALADLVDSPPHVLHPWMPSASVVIGGGSTYISPERLSSSTSGLGDPGVEAEERTCSLRKGEYIICIMLKE